MKRNSKNVNKVVFIGCSVGVLAASVSILCGAAASKKAVIRLNKSDFLRTDGRLIKNAQGETIVLRGVNIGGWLLQESWMCPNNGEDKVWGYYDTLALLTERFGEEKAVELINTYLDNWFTVSDIEYLKSLGVNCIRVPLWYRNFQSDDNGTWIRNKNGEIDFCRLDWVVEECGKRGIYVILDMHGAPGFQSNFSSCGKVNSSELFDCSLAGLKYRCRTADIWTELAKHFKGNPAVAAFDLLNEPMSGFNEDEKNDKQLWRFYNKLYKAVRAADPERMITVDLADRAKRKVPVLVGEFQAGGMWDNTRSAFNDNALSWCTRTYKGTKTAKSDRFLFAGEIEAANLQEDSFEQIKAKWGKPCRTTESFAENKDLAAVMRKYLTGYVEPISDTQETATPAVTFEIVNSDDHIPDTEDHNTSEQVKFVFGRATLVGMGTLATLRRKEKEND